MGGTAPPQIPLLPLKDRNDIGRFLIEMVLVSVESIMMDWPE